MVSASASGGTTIASMPTTAPRPNGKLMVVRSQLSRRMKRSLSLAAQLEKSETEYRITLNSLRQVADALGCDLVYALVPKQGSLHDLAERRASEEVSPDVLAVEHTMALENQAVGGVQEKIREEANRRLKRK